MKSILEFNLPDDKRELEMAVKGADAYMILYQIDTELRNYLKHGNDFKSPDDALNMIRDRLNSLCSEVNINIYE